MLRKFCAGIILFLPLFAAKRDTATVYSLMKEGAAMQSAEAAELEALLARKPREEKARIQLLAYYASAPQGVDVSAVIAARARHILWIMEHDPKYALGIAGIATGIDRLNCQGDSLADAGAFKQAAGLWMEQVRKHPGDQDIRDEAVAAIQYCLPDEAERLLLESRDRASLGSFYAATVLGVDRVSYKTGYPDGTDPAWRKRPIVERALSKINEATDADFLTAAARTLMQEGANLWADRKLDWDYTAIGNPLLDRAKAASPDAMNLFTLPTALPRFGERPPMTLRVGGNVQAKQLLKKVTLRYPQDAKSMRVQGVVQMTTLLGLDRKVMHLKVESGPPELIEATVAAVRQWEYRPTLLNGKPCYVLTRIDVTFTME